MIFSTIFRALEGLEILLILATFFILSLYYYDYPQLLLLKDRVLTFWLQVTQHKDQKSGKKAGAPFRALNQPATALSTSSIGSSSVIEQDDVYPTLPTGVTVDKVLTFPGKADLTCVDPFACLEDVSEDSTLQFLEDQQQLSESYIQHDLHEIQQKVLTKLYQMSNFESIENPINLGGTYFFFKRLRPELPQYSLFATKDLNMEAKLVFDPNILQVPTLSKSQEQQQQVEEIDDPLSNMPIVHATWISVDGYRLAYGYSHTVESTQMYIGVRDLVTGKDYEKDLIQGCLVDYTNVAWVESRTGFFYTTQVEVLTNVESDSTSTDTTTSSSLDDTAAAKAKKRQYSNRLLFHKLNTTQDHDFIVFETITDHNDLFLHVQITSDGHYLLLELSKRRHESSAASGFHAMVGENIQLGGKFEGNNHGNIGGGNKVYYYDLSKFDGLYAESLGFCVRLIDTFMYRFDYVSNIEDEFWFRTNYKAPNFRVVRVSLPDISQEDMEEIDFGDSALEIANATNRMRYKCLQAWKTCLDWIPQQVHGDYLESASIAAHTVLVLKYLKNGAHAVLLYDLTQTLVEESQIPVASLPHPSLGTINGPNCNFYSSEIFYQYSDFSDPSSIYRALIDRDPYTGRIEISFHQVNSTNLPGIEKHLFEVQHSFVENPHHIFLPIAMFGLRNVLDQGVYADEEEDSDHDEKTSNKSGTIRELEVEPITPATSSSTPASSGDSSSGASSGGNKAAAKKGKRTSRPCIICVNGGFGMTATPSFSLPLVLFSQYCKGIVIMAHVQGCGVYGTTWLEQGSQSKKDYAVQDLMAIIQHLVKEGYTTYSQIALYGGGHNGMLIGAAIAKYPMLFNVAVIEDGIFDLMKYQELNPPLSLYPKMQALKQFQQNQLWKKSLWYSEFGCMLDSEAEFLRILELSPLHNIAQHLTNSTSISTYPAVLCIAELSSLLSETSNIVNCKHSLKFVAQLQKVFSKLDCKKKPLLLYLANLENELLQKVKEVALMQKEQQQQQQEGSSNDSSQVHQRTYSGIPMDEVAMKFAFIIKNINAAWIE